MELPQGNIYFSPKRLRCFATQNRFFRVGLFPPTGFLRKLVNAVFPEESWNGGTAPVAAFDSR